MDEKYADLLQEKSLDYITILQIYRIIRLLNQAQTQATQWLILETSLLKSTWVYVIWNNWKLT